MRSGRGPIPKHLKLISGKTRGINNHEPEPPRGEIPTPPPELDLDARAEWVRTAPELHRVGILSTLDRTMFANYCAAYSRWIRAQRTLAEMAKASPHTYGMIYQKASGDWSKNPMVSVIERAQYDVVKYCTELGMTPVSRVRLRVDQPSEHEEQDPAAEYFKRS